MCSCRIENLEQSNEGVYICRASSSYGQAQDTARLTIQGPAPAPQQLLSSRGRRRRRRSLLDTLLPQRHASPFLFLQPCRR